MLKLVSSVKTLPAAAPATLDARLHALEVIVFRGELPTEQFAAVLSQEADRYTGDERTTWLNWTWERYTTSRGTDAA